MSFTGTTSILIGAGASIPYGGLSAKEVFYYLARNPELLADENIRTLIRRSGGDFETLYSMVFDWFSSEYSPEQKIKVKDAIVGVFDAMDKQMRSLFLSDCTSAFLERRTHGGVGTVFPTLRPTLSTLHELSSQNIIPIFSLNQDLLLERFLGLCPAGTSPQISFDNENPNSVTADPINKKQSWVTITKQKILNEAGQSKNPFYKLHGSFSWEDENGNMIIMGKEKHLEIPKKNILSFYFEILQETLHKINNLFIIGYSFRDEHINKIIREKMEQNNKLKILVFSLESDCKIDNIAHPEKSIGLGFLNNLYSETGRVFIFPGDYTKVINEYNPQPLYTDQIKEILMQ